MSRTMSLGLVRPCHVSLTASNTMSHVPSQPTSCSISGALNMMAGMDEAPSMAVKRRCAPLYCGPLKPRVLIDVPSEPRTPLAAAEGCIFCVSLDSINQWIAFQDHLDASAAALGRNFTAISDQDYIDLLMEAVYGGRAGFDFEAEWETDLLLVTGISGFFGKSGTQQSFAAMLLDRMENHRTTVFLAPSDEWEHLETDESPVLREFLREHLTEIPADEDGEA